MKRRTNNPELRSRNGRAARTFSGTPFQEEPPFRSVGLVARRHGLVARATRVVRRCVIFLGALALLTQLPERADAHGADLPKLTSAQRAAIQPALSNSIAFAHELLTHCRNQLAAPQLAVLERIGGALATGEQIRSGQVPDAGAQDGEYYRWQAETNLLALLTGATPSYFAFGVSDANVSGAVVSIHDEQGRQLLQSSRVSLRT